MGIQATKMNILKRILSLEQESIIRKIDEILDNEMIVGYTVDGKPLTKKAYDQRMELAEKQLKSGHIISQADLERDSENW